MTPHARRSEHYRAHADQDRSSALHRCRVALGPTRRRAAVTKWPGQPVRNALPAHGPDITPVLNPSQLDDQ